MPYILKDKKTGEFVTKGFRNYLAGRTPDANTARIFMSLSGISNWFGQRYTNAEEARTAWREEYLPRIIGVDYRTEMAIRNEWKDRYQAKVFRISVEEYYKIIEFDLNKLI